MSSQISIKTKDGRIINGISYSINPHDLTTNVPSMSATIPGGMEYGVYHIYTSSGWQYIPASQIATVLRADPGAQT